MAIKSKQLVALDSMVFIYYLDATDKKLNSAAEFLIEPLLQNKGQAITSIISVVETLSTPRYLGDQERLESYSLFFLSLPNLTVENVSWDIAQEAARLRRENKSLRTPDSIQLATALINKADVFITNDTRLTKLPHPPLKILSLSDIK
mgnify:CR=1 FL=1